MKKSKITIIVLLAVFVLSSCNFNSQYINREEDKKAAEEITNQFYEFIQNQDFNKSLDLFSNKFWEATPKEQMIQILSATREKLGDLEEINLLEWETRRVEGSNPSANYMLIFKNQYEKYEAIETIKLMKEDNNMIKIVAYNIESMGFAE